MTCSAAAIAAAAVTASPSVAGWRIGAALGALAVSAVLLSAALLRQGTAASPAAWPAAWPGTWPGTWPVALDIGVTAAICAVQGALLPPGLVAQGSSWVAAVASVAVVTAYLTLPTVAATCCGLVVAAAWTLGAGLCSVRGGGVAHLVTLAIQAAVMAVLMVALGRAAQAADRALEEHERAARSEAVEAARRLDERVARRTLHDTVLATLTMVGTGAIGAGSATLRLRAAEDMTVVDGLRTGPRGRCGPVRLDRWLAVAAERVRPLLSVTVELSPCTVPSVVADAMVGAVNEALANIAKYAETEVALLRLGTDRGAVVVEVMDAGVGFDPATVARHRLGLRESVIGRMVEVGGWATVVSAVGAGCRVTLGWPAGTGPRGG